MHFVKSQFFSLAPSCMLGSFLLLFFAQQETETQKKKKKSRPKKKSAKKKEKGKRELSYDFFLYDKGQLIPRHPNTPPTRAPKGDIKALASASKRQEQIARVKYLPQEHVEPVHLLRLFGVHSASSPSHQLPRRQSRDANQASVDRNVSQKKTIAHKKRVLEISIFIGGGVIYLYTTVVPPPLPPSSSQSTINTHSSSLFTRTRT